jgi:hypothetical protein
VAELELARRVYYSISGLAPTTGWALPHACTRKKQRDCVKESSKPRKYSDLSRNGLAHPPTFF